MVLDKTCVARIPVNILDSSVILVTCTPAEGGIEAGAMKFLATGSKQGAKSRSSIPGKSQGFWNLGGLGHWQHSPRRLG